MLINLQGLFSATQTKATEDLVRAGLRNPVKISIKNDDSASVSVNFANSFEYLYFEI